MSLTPSSSKAIDPRWREGTPINKLGWSQIATRAFYRYKWETALSATDGTPVVVVLEYFSEGCTLYAGSNWVRTVTSSGFACPDCRGSGGHVIEITSSFHRGGSREYKKLTCTWCDGTGLGYGCIVRLVTDKRVEPTLNGLLEDLEEQFCERNRHRLPPTVPAIGPITDYMKEQG